MVSEITRQALFALRNAFLKAPPKHSFPDIVRASLVRLILNFDTLYDSTAFSTFYDIESTVEQKKKDDYHRPLFTQPATWSRQRTMKRAGAFRCYDAEGTHRLLNDGYRELTLCV